MVTLGRLLVLLTCLSLAAWGQIYAPDPNWRSVGVGALASRPTTCGVNREFYICNGTGCTTNGTVHYCTGGLGATTFTGSGLNDLTFAGTPTAGGLAYRVEIDASVPSPDTFRWSDNGGAPWDATGVAITGAAQTLNNGVTVTFAAVDGHTVADRWDMTTGSWTVASSGTVNATAYGTATNCSSSASPAVCGSAAAGSVTVANGATTKVVNTTTVTANSQIFVVFDSSLGTKLSVTCNTTIPDAYGVTARTAGTSFTITVGVAPVADPACFSYFIVN